MEVTLVRLEPKINEHHGRIVRITGDGLLVEFTSVVAAVRCAIEVQRAIGELAVATSLLAELNRHDPHLFDQLRAGSTPAQFNLPQFGSVRGCS